MGLQAVWSLPQQQLDMAFQCESHVIFSSSDKLRCARIEAWSHRTHALENVSRDCRISPEVTTELYSNV